MMNGASKKIGKSSILNVKNLPRVEGWWKSANATQFVNYETIEMMIAFRKLLRNKEIDKARAMFEIFEFLN